jgi:hypothetical protein
LKTLLKKLGESMGKQKNKLILILSLFQLLLLQTGCSSMGKSMGLGGTIGAGTGAALGGIVDPGKNGQYRTRNVIIGAGVGAIAGTLRSSINP